MAFLGQVALGAQDRRTISMSAEEFSRLSVADQRALLVRAFERRRGHAKNLYYEAEQVVSWYEKDGNGERGKFLEEGPRRKYRHWRLGDSYRMDSDMIRPKQVDVLHWVSSGFDSEQGVCRSTMRTRGEKRTFGRIDTAHDPITMDNRYNYWLDGEYPHKEEYLFRYLLDHKDEFEIRSPVAGDKVQLTVGFQPWWADKPGGKRQFVLDPQKGFLPVQANSRWDGPPTGGNPNWRVEKFTVEESRLVGDVWMPIRLMETTAVGHSPRVAAMEISVSRIECDAVRPNDLVVPFTEGMEIVDAIKGVAYAADAHGNPAGKIHPLMGAKPAESPERPWGGWRRVAVFSSLGLFLFAVGWFLLRRLRNRPAST
jgi:hypothetical protein